MKGILDQIALHQVLLIAFCLVWRVFGEAQDEGDEDSNNDKNCTCMPIHPHQAYCNADFGRFRCFQWHKMNSLTTFCSNLMKKKNGHNFGYKF